MNKLFKVIMFMILLSLLLSAGCKQKKEMARIFGEPKVFPGRPRKHILHIISKTA